MAASSSTGITLPAGIVWQAGEDAMLKPQPLDVFTVTVRDDPTSPNGLDVQITDVQFSVKS